MDHLCTILYASRLSLCLNGRAAVSLARLVRGIGACPGATLGCLPGSRYGGCSRGIRAWLGWLGWS
eukprot:6153058-Alexandrium_andersonii.AAC.1